MAEMKSIFYWMPESPPCRTVLVVLKLIEFDDFDYKLIDLSKAEHLSDDYLEMNPFHTIPLWFESGSNLYLNESRTIARYLIETKKPESSLYPLDDVNKRAIINKLMDYELGTLFRHISDVVYPIFKPNQGLPNVEKIPYLKETLETFEKSLENLKDDEYLTGGTDITLADISIYFTMSLLQVIPELIDLSEYSSIYSWLNRMNEFFEQFDEINDNVLKKGQENLINYAHSYLEYRSSSSSSSLNQKNYFDVVIVGGGIVGSATARQLLLNRPNLSMAILEKENDLGLHQTGHNSGVIHAGIYYKPGSLKAKLCVEGCQLTYEYCDEKNIPYKRVGKLIVACDKIELERLMELYDRSLKNDVKGVQLLNTIEQIKKIEPNCVGLAAIWSPNTGIVDWGRVNRSYGNDFKQIGGKIFTNFNVIKFEFKTKSNSNNDEDKNDEYPIIIKSKDGQQIHSKYVITAAGLYSDKMAQLTNGKKLPKIVPFRGEYLVLRKESSDIVHTNIYPVPDPRFPFLGVHFTPRMDGSIWVGPNAVLAFKREGYRYSDINLKEFFETATFIGFLRLSFRYFRAGIDEMYRSLWTNAQIKKLQRFVPSITIDDIDFEKRISGVRAQALDNDGNLIDDFVFELDANIGRIMHVRNAPSPAATSSLAIARVIAESAQQEFKL